MDNESTHDVVTYMVVITNFGMNLSQGPIILQQDFTRR